MGLPPSPAAIWWPLDGQPIGVWRVPSIYMMSRISRGGRERGGEMGEERERERRRGGGSPTFGRGGRGEWGHPHISSPGCVALATVALPHSLLLHPVGATVGNVGGVEEAMSVLRSVESMDEDEGALTDNSARGKKGAAAPCNHGTLWGFGVWEG